MRCEVRGRAVTHTHNCHSKQRLRERITCLKCEDKNNSKVAQKCLSHTPYLMTMKWVHQSQIHGEGRWRGGGGQEEGSNAGV